MSGHLRGTFSSWTVQAHTSKSLLFFSVLFILITSFWLVFLFFQELLILHPLKQTLPYKPSSPMENVHHTKAEVYVSSDRDGQMCMCLQACAVLYKTTHRKETENGKDKPLCLSWNWANHLPLRAKAGTNLLKVICNYCGWEGLPHQCAFVRHFISKCSKFL